MDSEIQKLLEERKKLLEMNLQSTIDILKEIYDVEEDYTPPQEEVKTEEIIVNDNIKESVIKTQQNDMFETQIVKPEETFTMEESKIENETMNNEKTFLMEEEKPKKLIYDKNKVYYVLTKEFDFSDEQANVFISKIENLDEECYNALIESLPGRFDNLKVGDWSVTKLINLGYKIPTCYSIIAKLKKDYDSVNAKLMEVK